ncbi:unnamed protein product [Cuscuta campestris]|uniref:Uncharacterized protein n=1 Tax=Cuscuta campestris TaxID=132261 RepID=A0A484MD39_9ASTE|nr:unnamed protein product [Cuscuta campestris]
MHDMEVENPEEIVNGDEEGHSHRKCSVDNCEVDHDSILCLLNSEMMGDEEEGRFLESNVSRTSESLSFKHKRVLDYIEMDFDSSENVVHVPLCSDDKRLTAPRLLRERKENVKLYKKAWKHCLLHNQMKTKKKRKKDIHVEMVLYMAN